VPKGKFTMWCNRHCVRPSSDSHASCQSSSKCTTMSAWRNRDLLYSLISTQGTIAGSLDHNLTPMARSLRHYCFLELFMKVKHNSDQYCPIHGDEARPRNSATVAVVPCTGEKYLIYRRKKAGWSMYPPALGSRSMRNCCTPLDLDGGTSPHPLYLYSLFLVSDYQGLSGFVSSPGAGLRLLTSNLKIFTFRTWIFRKLLSTNPRQSTPYHFKGMPSAKYFLRFQKGKSKGKPPLGTFRRHILVAHDHHCQPITFEPTTNGNKSH